ncbi:KIN-9 protein [Aphelenchoides avenae]|nr:KIN-9 protein [Aphelenchus avenae]
MVTVDDLYYAVNVSIGTNSTNAQQFTLTVDIKGTDTTLADVSLKPRHGRGFVLHNASSVQENDPGYYLMKDYVQFSPSVGLFLNYIIVLDQWNASRDLLWPYASQPFDGVLGLVEPFFIRMYSLSFEKTCSNGTLTDGGMLTINGLDSTSCGEFTFVNRSQDMCFPFLTVPTRGILLDNDLDMSPRSVVVADVPYIYVPTTTFNRLNKAYNTRKEGDVYIVDCDANPGPLAIAIGNDDDDDDDDDNVIELNYTDLIERIDERRCALRVRPSTGYELECYVDTIGFILGLPFLQRYCVAATIDGDNAMRIGFAPKTTSERQTSRVCDYRGIIPTAMPTPNNATLQTSTVMPTKGGLQPGLIVLIVVALFVSLCTVTALGYCCYRRRIKAVDHPKLTLSGFPHYTLPPVSVFNSLFNQFTARRDPWQINENELNFSTAREIGSGAFAKVFVVEVEKSLEKRLNVRATVANRKAKVVVKVARRSSEEIKHDMQQEIDLMKELGNHPHIVNFIGYLASECPLIVMEYCANGDLLNYLRTHLQKHKESVNDVNEYLQPACYSNSDLSLKDLISLCWQIADGLVGNKSRVPYYGPYCAPYRYGVRYGGVSLVLYFSISI